MDWTVASPASLISKEVVLERLADPSFFRQPSSIDFIEIPNWPPRADLGTDATGDSGSRLRTRRLIYDFPVCVGVRKSSNGAGGGRGKGSESGNES